MQIDFRDFVPAMTEYEKPPFLSMKMDYGRPSPDDREPLRSALAEANRWIRDEGVDVVTVETVVIPSIFGRGEEGPEDPAVAVGHYGGTFYQFLRVWYRTR